MLQLTNIRKSYGAGPGEVRAVEDCSIEVRDSEFVSIVGPSGCGKSTLLYIAAGLDHPTSGAVTLDERSVTGPAPDRGMIFQSYTLFPWLSVSGNINFSHQLEANINPRMDVSRILSKIEYAGHLMEIMGLEDFRDRYPQELSGGMKQRVAIARALANQPRILLMDEPFAALDAQTREELQELTLLLRIHENTTNLLVTHDIEEAIYLSDRIIVLSHRPGRVIQEMRVPFPKDRQLDIKLSPEFIALKQQITRLLHGGEGSRTRDDLLRRLGKHFRSAQSDPSPQRN